MPAAHNLIRIFVAGLHASYQLGSFSAPITWKKSPFEKYQASVKIETTPDERRVLNAAHLAASALRRTFEHWVLS